MEDTDMLGELAQFSSLEQLTAVNETLESMAEAFNAQLVNSAVSFIGLDVVAEGDTITKGEDGVSDLTYTLGEDASAATAYLYDSEGNLVANISLDSLEAGDNTFSWDGTDGNGQELEDGTYTVSIVPLNADGEIIDVSTLCEGTVVGMTTQNGSTVLELDDGRYVDLMSITSVHTPTSS